MFLHQSTEILIRSIDAVTNITNLTTISNMHIPAHFTATLPTRQTCACITVTLCTLEVQIDKIVSIKPPNLSCYQWFI